MYSDAEQSMVLYRDMAKRNASLLIIVPVFPFMRVTYDLCLGQYTIDSWFFLLSFWSIYWNAFSVELNLASDFPFIRLPFKLDTTLRCIIMAFVQLYVYAWIPVAFFSVLSFDAGVVLYIQTLLTDLKSLFHRIDKLLRLGKLDAQSAALEYCKEAIDLHSRIYRQYSIQSLQLFANCFIDYAIYNSFNSCTHQLADVMNLVIFGAVTPSIATICLTILLFDMVSSVWVVPIFDSSEYKSLYYCTFTIFQYSSTTAPQHFMRCFCQLWHSWPFWTCCSFYSTSAKCFTRVWSNSADWFISQNGIAIHQVFNAVSWSW